VKPTFPAFKSRAVHEDMLDFLVCNCNLRGITPLSGTLGRDVKVAIWTELLASGMTWG
jgi:hypothetical protein